MACGKKLVVWSNEMFLLCCWLLLWFICLLLHGCITGYYTVAVYALLIIAAAFLFLRVHQSLLCFMLLF